MCCSQQTPRNFNTRGIGLGTGDRPAGEIAFNLMELVAIDRGIRSPIVRALTATKRPKHGKNCRRGHQRQHQPEHPHTPLSRDPPRVEPANVSFSRD
jgi:hypothetical protein